MPFNYPTIADFQAYFFRDFPYGTDINTCVTDQDIGNAFNLVNININQDLFANQANFNIGYFYLAAHYLVMSLRSSSQGVNGQFEWLENSKGVGAINVSEAIPQYILDNPYFSMYFKTNYGAQFMFLILPQLLGPVGIAPGSTRP